MTELAEFGVEAWEDFFEFIGDSIEDLIRELNTDEGVAVDIIDKAFEELEDEGIIPDIPEDEDSAEIVLAYTELVTKNAGLKERIWKIATDDFGLSAA